MAKLDLINKEKKDCKNYLNYLYNQLKQETNKEEISRIQREIDAYDEARTILLNLANISDDETLLSELEKISNKYESEFNNLDPNFEYEDDTLKAYDMKIRVIKGILDNVNEKYLSKEEIAEYLDDFRKVMKLAYQNHKVSFYDNFLVYMNTKGKSDKANKRYYSNMIKLHITFLNMSMVGNAKDLDFENVDGTDEVLKENTKVGDLAFIKDRFIKAKDGTRFSKMSAFNYIRNAFFHTDGKELYKISRNCDFVFIDLKATNPVPFNVKLFSLDLVKMALGLSRYSHHAITVLLEGQDKIDIKKLFGTYEEFETEIDKTKLVRAIYDNKTQLLKSDIHKELIDTDSLFEVDKVNNLLNKYGTFTQKKYSFSQQQKKLVYDKLQIVKDYLNVFGLEYFVVPTICHYMSGAAFKYDVWLYESLMANMYYFNSNCSVFDINMDILYDWNVMLKYGIVPFDKPSIFSYLSGNVDYDRRVLLNLFDLEDRNNCNDVLYYTYVFGSINTDSLINVGGKDINSEFIRNAFTHDRWRIFEQNGKKYIYLYDDEDMLVDPNNAYWSDTFLYEDLESAATNIINKFRNNNVKTNNL